MSVNPLLKQIASRQRGYFTANQAVQAGYSKELQRYYLSSNQWAKIDRSVYRLSGYADTLESQFIRWSLWAIGRGHERLIAISHESALYYYGLTDESATKTHISVSSPLYRMSLPDECVLHYNTLEAEDYIRKSGFKVTTPHRTLCDMRPDLVYDSRWLNTVKLALSKELINKEIAGVLLGEVLYKQMLNTEQSWGKVVYAASSTSVGSDALANNLRSTGMRDLRERTQVAGRTGWRIPNRSFTLVEMLVIIGIICIITSMLMPALIKSIESARKIHCSNNLKQIGLMAFAYADDNNGWLFYPNMAGYGGGRWPLALYDQKYTDDKAVFNCPNEPMAAWVFTWGNNCMSYGLNISTFGYSLGGNYPRQKLSRINALRNSANLIFFSESTPTQYLAPNNSISGACIAPPSLYPLSGTTAWFQTYVRHDTNSSAITCFFDGHAGPLDYLALQDWKHWSPTMRGSALPVTLRSYSGTVW